MKKILLFASALAGLFLAGSCQRENLEPVAGGTTVTYTVKVPDAIATKADEGVTNLIYEVYRAAEVGEPSKNPIYEGKATLNNGEASLELEFVKNQNFTVLFWAQDPDVTAYDTKDLRAVTLTTSLTANDAHLAVFAGSDDVEDCVSKAGGNVSLVRPVSQINIATFPESLKVGTETSYTEVGLVASSATVKNGLYQVYNVANKNVSEARDFEYTSATVPTGTLKVGTTDYTYVAMNYVGFAPETGATVDVDFTIVTTEGDIEHSVSSVPVKPNYKTNLTGNLITASDNYQVTLGAWDTPDTNVEVVAVSTAQDLQEAIENIQAGGAEGNIILEGDIDLGDLFGASTLSVTKAGGDLLPIVIPVEKTMTLDLNGFTITTPWEDETAGKHYYAFDNKGTLNIVDSKVNGEIIARGIFNYGKMTLESGTINACDGNGGYGVRNYEGAEFVMNGGTVATLYEDGDAPGNGYDACPIRVDEGAKALINGGYINNISNFTCAIDNHGETIVYDGTFTSVHTTLANHAVMTINGGSFTCNGLEGITAHALWADAGTTTINGGTFNGKDNYNGFNVDASAGAVVNITGGEFLPVHSGSLYGEGTINVTGGEFFDDPSERVAEGYGVVANENGTFTVEKLPTVAKIGDTEYLSLREAVKYVQEGETITILEGTIEEGTIKLPASLKNVTFKGEEGAVLKDMTVMAQDGNSISYEGLTFDGLTLDNSRISITGWRTNGAVVKNFTVTNCIFRSLDDTTNSAPVHINMDADEAVNGFTFTNNVIDGATGGSKSGIYAQVTGEVLVSGNVINNVSFRPYVIQVTTDDGVADNFIVTENTFSGSAAGRAQGLGNNDEGTDVVTIVVSDNIFKGITDAQQICYWNFNDATTEFDLSGNYYDIDILANPSRIYYNGAASGLADLIAKNIFPIYTELNADGTINKDSAYTPSTVAKIGDLEYYSLQEALNAGGEITLLRNVKLTEMAVLEAGKTATLDLNGCNITVPDATKHIYAINNKGNLTLKDSKGTGSVKARGIYNGYNGSNTDETVEGATMTVESGNYYALDENGGAAIFNCAKAIINGGVFDGQVAAFNGRKCAETTINGGVFRSVNNYAIQQNNGGELSIKAATVDRGFGAVGCYGGKVTIADGEFLPTGTAGTTCHVVYVYAGADVTINGGTYKMNYPENAVPDSGSAVASYYNGTLAINGGTFTAHFDNVSPVELSSGSTIKGGTYYNHAGVASQHDYIKNYVAEDYELNANGEVVKK